MRTTANNLGIFILALALWMPVVSAADERAPADLFASAAVAFEAHDYARSAELLEQLLLKSDGPRLRMFASISMCVLAIF